MLPAWHGGIAGIAGNAMSKPQDLQNVEDVHMKQGSKQVVSTDAIFCMVLSHTTLRGRRSTFAQTGSQAVSGKQWKKSKSGHRQTHRQLQTVALAQTKSKSGGDSKVAQ